MSDKKPGLLKRIFSFGFGRKKEEAAEQPELENRQAAEPAEIQAEAPADAQSAEREPEAITKESAPADAVADTQSPPAAKKAEEVKPPAKKPSEKPAAKKQKPAPQKAASKPSKPKARQEDRAAKTVAEPAKEAAPEPTAPKVAPAPAKPKIQKPAHRAEPQRTDPPPVPSDEPAPAAPAAIEESAMVETKGVAKARPKSGPKSGKVRLFDEKPEPVAEEAPDEEARRSGWFARMRKGLSRSTDALTGNIAAVFTKARLDDDTLQDLEDILIQADLGAPTAAAITEALAAERYGKDVSDEEVRSVMATEIEKVLAPVALPLELDLEHQPHVILVVGVNGSGKTTTIGKLSDKLRAAGLSTLLVAGDTFRAAAIEQLKIWGERTGTPVASRELGADAAGLAFDAYAQARDEGHDVLLMDTAGRLQNKTELMAELEKIIRVMKKQDETAPHTVLLTLDATTGQNALNQVEIFAKTAGVNGLVMTKLDGTARGGILVSIAAKHNMPVYFIGVGEGVDDLEPFEAAEFARSIAGLSNTQTDREAV